MDEERIRRLFDYHKHEELKATPLEELSAVLLLVMEGHENARQPANFDYLIALGITFARSGHENADAAVLQWLTNKPSEKRIDIASAFLCGLWDRRFRENPVPPDRIEKFIRELNTVTLNDDDAAYSSILALAEVMKSDSSTYIKEEVAAILRSAYKRQCKDKIQEEMLRSVIEEVLGNDG